MQISGKGVQSSRDRTVMAIAPQSSSATLTSTGIPVIGFSTMGIALLVGAMTATATIDLSLEESDTLGGTYVAISGAVMAQRLAASHASKVWTADLNLSGRKAFVRVVCACATAASLVAVECTLSGADRTERVQAAQLGSSPAASPLSSTDSLFSV